MRWNISCLLCVISKGEQPASAVYLAKGWVVRQGNGASSHMRCEAKLWPGGLCLLLGHVRGPRDSVGAEGKEDHGECPRMYARKCAPKQPVERSQEKTCSPGEQHLRRADCWGMAGLKEAWQRGQGSSQGLRWCRLLGGGGLLLSFLPSARVHV